MAHRGGYQTRMAAQSHSASQGPTIAGELVVVRAAGEAPLLRRRDGRASDRVEQLTTLLAALIGKDAAIDKLAYRKILEARAPASVKALANDLACYATFDGAHAARGEGMTAIVSAGTARGKDATCCHQLWQSGCPIASSNDLNFGSRQVRR